ncbi:MAG: helix-turn-helix transcriptional regulator [Candidatus Hodarchaeales archaeon]|jgi:uncharacterized membrane protein
MRKLLNINQNMTHMSSHSTTSDSLFVEGIIIGLFIFGLILLLLIIFLIIYYYRKNRLSYPNKPLGLRNNDILDDKANFLEEETSVLELKTNQNNVSQETLSLSIDEQEYQRKRILDLILRHPHGILQSKLPKITDLSKATISRRLNELDQENKIIRRPKGRSILISSNYYHEI